MIEPGGGADVTTRQQAVQQLSEELDAALAAIPAADVAAAQVVHDTWQAAVEAVRHARQRLRDRRDPQAAQQTVQKQPTQLSTARCGRKVRLSLQREQKAPQTHLSRMTQLNLTIRAPARCNSS